MEYCKSAYNFLGKTVLITGGAAGIGFSTAQMFADAGSEVILIDKDEMIAQRAQEIADKSHTKTIGIQADITDTENLAQVKKQCLSQFSRVDVLVNNAGLAALDAAEHLSQEDWNKTMALNLSSVFFMTQTFVPEMIQRKKGKIVNIASQAGIIALDKHVAYCVSKAGVLSMTKVMALEWGKHNININAISPTVVLTELGKKAWSGEVGEHMKRKIPMQRFAYPQEISAAVLFLASESSNMVQGENLVIDGGYSIQ